MFLTKKTLFRVMIFATIITSFIAVRAVYVPTNRDTKEAPEVVTYDITEPTEMTLLYETTDFKYYFRESRDTIAIYDKRNGYTWKTGTDLEYNKDIDDECDDTLDLYEEQFTNVDLAVFNNFTATTNNENTIVSGDFGSLKVVVDGLTDSSLSSDINFQLVNLTLENTKQYRLTFTASGYDQKDIQVSLGTYVSEVFTVTGDSQEFTIDFTMNDITDNAVTLQFELGKVGTSFTNTTLKFDDIKLEETDGTDITPDTNQISRGDFELLETELTTTEDDLLLSCRPQEVKLNTTYTGFANSLVTIEYYDISNNIKRISSASHMNVSSELKTVTESHYRLDIDFKKQDIEMSVHIYLDNAGIRYEIRDEEISGDGVDVLAAVILSPFLGASGGAYEEFDTTELDYKDEEIFKYKVPGYTFLPDGSGTLVRYSDNNIRLNPYEGSVYGNDVGQAKLHYDESSDYVEFKEPTMPVFGMAHGNDQAAFVAYATKGDEYMQIISMPEENLTYYDFTYPRFEYNQQYFQVYNKMGWGFLTLYEDRNHFDIEMRYDFLSGDGSTGPSADYVGMAQQYREYLISEDILHEIAPDYTDIPLRLDFFMSDVEDAVTGYSNMVTTDVDGVDNILKQVQALGITNINSGLLGWNDGGITIGDTSDTDFTREIGRKGEFEDLINMYKELGIDISFADDYYSINEEMMNLRQNATQHTSTWYARIETNNNPVSEFYFARPVKSVEWLFDHVNDFNKLGVSSYTIDGITNHLTSDYTDYDEDSELAPRTTSKEIILNGFAELDSDKLVNSVTPNAYLWQYTDRYLQAPVYGTQHLIESDTVPFLQLVLQNTMELYGPYSNFSFYTQTDILRMIDYNIYPNFVLTEQPAYLLADTNSRNFYSTQYELYEELIDDIYSNVNTALSPVIGANWVDRTVLENGVILNSYDNGVEVVINYTEDVYTYNGTTVEALDFVVVGD